MNNRPVLVQRMTSVLWAVGTAPTPIASVFNPQAELVTSFTVSVYSTAANNIFIGDGNVSIGSGMEIIAGGGPVSFELVDERMQYELQDPLMRIAATMQCENRPEIIIPITVWDLSQIFGIATAATNVSITTFRKQYI